MTCEGAIDQRLECRFGILVQVQLRGAPGAAPEAAVVETQHAKSELLQLPAVPDLFGCKGRRRVAVQVQNPITVTVRRLRRQQEGGQRGAILGADREALGICGQLAVKLQSALSGVKHQLILVEPQIKECRHCREQPERARPSHGEQQQPAPGPGTTGLGPGHRR
jgi:hypothetical protein